METKVFELAERVKALELQATLNGQALSQRLERLEAEAEQRRVDHEQASRRETAALRKEIDDLKAERQKAIDDAAVEANRENQAG